MRRMPVSRPVPTAEVIYLRRPGTPAKVHCGACAKQFTPKAKHDRFCESCQRDTPSDSLSAPLSEFIG